MSIPAQMLRPARALPRPRWGHAATLMLMLCALFLGSGIAQAKDGGSPLSAADEKALQTYALRAETVDRALAVAQDARKEKISGSTGKDAKSIDAWAAGLSGNPQAKALLDRHQIAARDYVMTMIAVMRAGYAAEANPKTPEEAGTNAGNIAFMKANKTRVTAALQGGANPAPPADAKAGKAEQAK